jgi:signal peptidase II
VSPAARAGALLAAVIFAADQATKLWVLHGLHLQDGPVEVTPFMEFVLVWNRGISYGLLQQEGLGRWLLVAVTVVASVALAVWLARSQRRLVALAVGGILGGALGNLVDRVVYGAVVDFVHLHWGRFSWYVFNVADAAIVIGVALLLLDSLVSPRTRQTEA